MGASLRRSTKYMFVIAFHCFSYVQIKLSLLLGVLCCDVDPKKNKCLETSPGRFQIGQNRQTDTERETDPDRPTGSPPPKKENGRPSTNFSSLLVYCCCSASVSRRLRYGSPSTTHTRKKGDVKSWRKHRVPQKYWNIVDSRYWFDLFYEHIKP